MEIDLKEIDETEREKRKKQFQIEYEQEKAEKNQGEKTEFDNIEMPNSPIRGTIIGIFLFAVVWAGEFGLAFAAKQYWSLPVFGLPFLGVTIGGIVACQEYWSDYRLAKRNFMAYKVKMWAKRKKEDGK